MKKKSTSQSAFFNLRVLIGLFTVLAGVFLALVGFGTFSAQAQKPTITQSINPLLLPPGFDCAQIHTLGLNRMESLRAGAIMIACGEAQGGKPSPAAAFSKFVQGLLPAPLAYGATDKNLITGAEIFSHITQSETFAAANPDNPDQIVVAYNDSRDWGGGGQFIDISAASVSTDGGTTFTRLTTAQGRSPFANTTGDPVALYNRSTGSWHTIWIGDSACGGGLGGFRSTTPWDPNSWTTHYCVNANSFDDRESGAVDQNPASPFYGRLYVSWNDFDTINADIFVRFSTNDGTSWTSRQVSSGGFFRNVQITTDLMTGDVYIAAMNEMNGGLTNRANRFYKSTDGGNSWSLVYSGPTFPAPGRTTCPNSYFACMFTGGGGYWRHMGWGQHGARNGIVHYVYDSRNTGNGDPANVFYIRSTNGGTTFSAPFQLNTDTGTRAQWQPNLSVAEDGSLLAVWYDERETTNCVKGDETVPCYRMWARKSTNEGVSWLADMEFSDVVTPLPGQPDPGIIAEYAGDYDYSYHVGNEHLHPWTDGRVTINSQSQQDAFFDKEGGGGGGGIPCGDLVSFQARCQSDGTRRRIQARLTLTDASHSGEQVTITVDGNPNSVTIIGNRAQLQINNPAVGQHTVELTDPAGCFAPVVTTCN
jgi:hypothetical protein